MSPALLADHLVRAVSGPAWHGPALDEALEGVTPEEAAARPIAGAHTIGELVVHLAAWARIAAARLAGDASVPTDAEDFPPPPAPVAEAWAAALGELRDGYGALAAAVRSLDPARLDAMLPGRDHTARTMLLGVAEHAAYHGGQIVLLSKLLRASRRPD